ncbi:MAG: alkaline phosphatase family protein [Lewinellaceae bacterium]|nr:alkaline phosphatase family protein [Lewinellaceae bacterium]
MDAAVRFWAGTPDARRKALLPFLWLAFADQGQIYGNRDYGNNMDVANRWAFSYPGYNEMFTGRPDNWRIFSNRKIHNPNKNLLEFFQQQPHLRDKVAAFTSWDAFPYILNARRAGIPVNSGKENRRPRPHNRHLPPGKFDDPFTWSAAMAYIYEQRPHVIYIGLNATDLLGHAGNYPAYLGAAHQFDQYLDELWTYLQQDSMYRRKSTLIVTTDHGRGGKTIRRWMEHNRHLSGSSKSGWAPWVPMSLYWGGTYTQAIVAKAICTDGRAPAGIRISARAESCSGDCYDSTCLREVNKSSRRATILRGGGGGGGGGGPAAARARRAGGGAGRGPGGGGGGGGRGGGGPGPAARGGGGRRPPAAGRRGAAGPGGRGAGGGRAPGGGGAGGGGAAPGGRGGPPGGGPRPAGRGAVNAGPPPRRRNECLPEPVCGFRAGIFYAERVFLSKALIF